MKRLPLTLFAAPMIVCSSCAQDTSRYPSLLPRAVESRSDAETVTAMPVLAADPELDARIATITAALAKADSAFDMVQSNGATIAARARGAAVGSDAWLDAQSLVATLSTARARSQTALVDAEALASGRAAAALPGYPDLNDLEAAASAQVDRQSVIIDTLLATIARTTG